MAIKQYEENGQQLWRVTIHLRSKINPNLRLQAKRNGIENEKSALVEEKKLIRELSDKLAKLEAQGATWDAVIGKWESEHLLFPTSRYCETTVKDHAARLRNWTKDWLSLPASQITRGDARDVIRRAKTQGKNDSFLRRLRNTVNVIYRWGMEERMITGVTDSPASNLEIEKDVADSMRLPEILSRDQVKRLLQIAKLNAHSWYPIWAFVVLTGMRSGEAFALRRSDVEMIPKDKALLEDKKPASLRRYGFVRVTKTWNVRLKKEGPTKGRRWRTVPISGGLYWMLTEYLAGAKAENEYLFPRFSDWKKGMQAQVLRKFCKGHGLPSIKFHTLRACFATHLIADGVPAATVMKIGGWQDLETLSIYLRMAGVEEAGATETLDFVPEDEVMDKVVSLYDFRGGRS